MQHLISPLELPMQPSNEISFKMHTWTNAFTINFFFSVSKNPCSHYIRLTTLTKPLLLSSLSKSRNAIKSPKFFYLQQCQALKIVLKILLVSLPTDNLVKSLFLLRDTAKQELLLSVGTWYISPAVECTL